MMPTSGSKRMFLFIYFFFKYMYATFGKEQWIAPKKSSFLNLPSFYFG